MPHPDIKYFIHPEIMFIEEKSRDRHIHSSVSVCIDNQLVSYCSLPTLVLYILLRFLRLRAGLKGVSKLGLLFSEKKITPKTRNRRKF
jgi:hypothetical protein